MGEHQASSLSIEDLDAQNACRNADSAGLGKVTALGCKLSKILALTNLHLSLTSHAAFPKELVVPDENSLFDFDPWKAECCVVVGNRRRKG